jgi:hypothetical protein
MSVKGERSSGEEMVEAPNVIVDTGDVYTALKIKVPGAYGGEESKLRHFWLHDELFLGFNSKKFMSEQEKSLWVITLLEGPALSWIEGFLQDYITHHYQSTNSYAHVAHWFISPANAMWRMTANQSLCWLEKGLDDMT